MATIQVTDNVDLSADLQLRDDCPLAKAGLAKLVSTAKQLFADFAKPVDQASAQSFSLGSTFTSPNLPAGDLSSMAASVGANCALTLIKPADKLLFPDDGFSPRIPIETNQAWVGVEFDVIGGVNAGASMDGIGISFSAGLKFSNSTYTLFSPAAPPLPSLRDACANAFSHFSLIASAAALRGQLPGTVTVAEVQGSVTVGVALQLPFAINALASANLPFNKSVSIQPTVSVQLTPSVDISGDLVVRSWKKSDEQLCFGVYKARGATLSVTFNAGAGLEGDLGSTDVLGRILNAVLPGIDVTKAGIATDNAEELNAAIKGGLERSLSAQVNAAFSASTIEEAAVLYEINLDPSDKVDHALGKALHGDWTELERLSVEVPQTVRRLRNIAVETNEKRLSLNLNLFGFYSAVSIDDYVKSCTVLVDDGGQISIIDKSDASRISASSAPFAADADKLRKALMEDFFCTATYAVVAGKLNLTMTAKQTYFEYDRNMSRTSMKEVILLGYALGLIPFGSLDEAMKANRTFPHALIRAELAYGMEDLLRLFFKDVNSLIPRSTQELEVQGRRTMAALLDEDDPVEAVRKAALQNDTLWKDMNETGNVSQFPLLAGLRGLNPVLLEDISVDWRTIVWWAEAVSKIAPQLKTTLEAVSASSQPDPRSDRAFINARDRLADMLGTVTRKSDAPFAHGWGEAVTFGLSGGKAQASMDLVWSGHALHYSSRTTPEPEGVLAHVSQGGPTGS